MSLSTPLRFQLSAISSCLSSSQDQPWQNRRKRNVHNILIGDVKDWVCAYFNQAFSLTNTTQTLAGRQGRACCVGLWHNNSSSHAEASLGFQITAQHAAAKESGHTFCVTFLSGLKICTSARFSRQCVGIGNHIWLQVISKQGCIIYQISVRERATTA